MSVMVLFPVASYPNSGRPVSIATFTTNIGALNVKSMSFRSDVTNKKKRTLGMMGVR